MGKRQQKDKCNMQKERLGSRLMLEDEWLQHSLLEIFIKTKKEKMHKRRSDKKKTNKNR